MVLPSASLVPHDDPSLLFVNAGMVPFKRVFMGQEKRDYTAAATAQKCVRAGGKHNDLDMVGHTKRHHTFFEMLGNFSFGAYFKERAIALAWQLLTDRLGLDPKRLWITVYHTDDAARKIWRKVAGFSDDRILSIDSNDNFWSMGSTGPCGPCTEIFYDHGPHLWGGLPGTPEQDGDRFVEIWNLVFMQYNQAEDGTRTPLPTPGVDTGAGIERLAAVLEGVDDNYKTGLFQGLMKAAAAQLGLDEAAWEQEKDKAPLRVVADHLRSIGFLLADGVMPDAEGRGYVLRRIIRRAARYGVKLGCDRPFLANLLPALDMWMGAAYPELVASQAAAHTILEAEEKAFLDVLLKAEGLVADATKGLKSGQVLSGTKAFRLYDTFGLPLDTMHDMLAEKGLSLDTKGFEAALQQQRKRAKSGSGFKDSKNNALNIPKDHPTTFFTGYASLESDATVQFLFMDGKEVQALEKGQTGVLVVGQTPFYAESGGQQGDAGTVKGPHGLAAVLDTQKQGDVFLHHVQIRDGRITAADPVQMVVDPKRRQGLVVHHSATHLLHAALRNVLGEHVAQRGSLVMPEKLRFDFSHSGKLSNAERQAVQDLVNEEILRAQPLNAAEMPLEAAKQVGAMALFGENYGSVVRVVTVGDAGPGAPSFSKELCGGTHVHNTGALGLFKVVSETGVSKGVRRIEAVAGKAALSYFESAQDHVDTLSSLLNASADGIVEKVKNLLDQKKQLAKGAQGKAPLPSDEEEIEEKTVGDVHVVVKYLGQADIARLRQEWDQLRKKHEKVLAVLLGTSVQKKKDVPEEKVFLTVVGSSSSYAAEDVLKRLVASCGGKGGGKADLAQGQLNKKPSIISVLGASS